MMRDPVRRLLDRAVGDVDRPDAGDREKDAVAVVDLGHGVSPLGIAGNPHSQPARLLRPDLDLAIDFHLETNLGGGRREEILGQLKTANHVRSSVRCSSVPASSRISMSTVCR